jgi:hypothetical protein
MLLSRDWGNELSCWKLFIIYGFQLDFAKLIPLVFN